MTYGPLVNRTCLDCGCTFNAGGSTQVRCKQCGIAYWQVMKKKYRDISLKYADLDSCGVSYTWALPKKRWLDMQQFLDIFLESDTLIKRVGRQMHVAKFLKLYQNGEV